MIRLSNSSWRRYCEAILCFVTRSLTRVETVHTRRHTHTLPNHRFGHRSRRTPTVGWPKLAQVHTLAADILDLCCGALATGMKLIYLVTVNLSPFWLATRPAHSWQSTPPPPTTRSTLRWHWARCAGVCCFIFCTAPYNISLACRGSAVCPSGPAKWLLKMWESFDTFWGENRQKKKTEYCTHWHLPKVSYRWCLAAVGALFRSVSEKWKWSLYFRVNNFGQSNSR